MFVSMQKNKVLFQNITAACACLSIVLFLNFLPIFLKPFFCSVNKLSLQGINNNNNKAKFSFQIVTNKNVLQYVFNIVFFNMVATYRY